MTYLFARSLGPVLAQFAWSKVLLAFDFDGTLSPICTRPADARIGATTRRLLLELTRSYPCAVISGRAREDVASRLRGIPFVAIAGNHGLEPSRSERHFEQVVRAWIPRLQAGLGGMQGVFIEDKRLSVALHYRRSRAKRAALLAIRNAAASLGPLRLIPGKLVVNLLPPGAPHKGLALEALLARTGCDTALYVGDDDTDEDVFAMAAPGRVLGVRVGRKAASLARYYLRGQSEVDRLLRTLRDLRARDSVGRKVKTA